MASGGGSGWCVFPPPHVEENGNQEMLRGLLKHTKIRILYGYFVYKILTKHIFNYKIVKKIGPHCSRHEVLSG